MTMAGWQGGKLAEVTGISIDDHNLTTRRFGGNTLSSGINHIALLLAAGMSVAAKSMRSVGQFWGPPEAATSEASEWASETWPRRVGHELHMRHLQSRATLRRTASLPPKSWAQKQRKRKRKRPKRAR